MTGNVFMNALAGLEAGQAQRDRRDRRNALAQWREAPEEAMFGLVQSGALEEAGALGELTREREARDARAQIAPLVVGGDYQGAARGAAGAGQLDLAAQLMNLSASELAQARERGERGASILFAASSLRPEQRPAFMAQYRDEAVAAGIPDAAFDQFDWTNDGHIRAAAAGWLEASQVAGSIEAQRVGDNLEVVRTDPVGGQRPLSSREIPMSRDERFERQRYEEDRDYRRERDAADDAYRDRALDATNSTGDVLGPLLRAYANGETLTEPQQAIVDRYLQGGQEDALAALLYGSGGVGGGGGQQRPASGGGSRDNPARPMSEADFNALPPGAWFINPADGALLQKDR